MKFAENLYRLGTESAFAILAEAKKVEKKADAKIVEKKIEKKEVKTKKIAR